MTDRVTEIINELGKLNIKQKELLDVINSIGAI